MGIDMRQGTSADGVSYLVLDGVVGLHRNVVDHVQMKLGYYFDTCKEPRWGCRATLWVYACRDARVRMGSVSQYLAAREVEIPGMKQSVIRDLDRNDNEEIYFYTFV